VFKRRRGDDRVGPEGATEGTGAPHHPAVPHPPFEPTPPDAHLAPAGTDTGLGVSLRPSAPSREETAMGRAPSYPVPNPQGPGAQPSVVPPNGVPVAPRPPLQATPRPMHDPAERRTLVVGRGISVQGTVQDAERLVVEGIVEATMIHAAELNIAPGGVFKGEAEVDEAEIAGTIDGTLTARGSLMVRGTGRVLGTARCRRLQVEDGGQITGRMEMIAADSQPPASRAPSHATETTG
jgi:cytoskeletal protein CcmA (bactofilin family)